MDLTRKFSLDAARRIAGMSASGKRTLDAWIQREGQLSLEADADRAPGQHREPTLRDVIRICAWAEISRARLSPIDLPEAVKAIEENLYAVAVERAVLSIWEKAGKFLVMAGPTRADTLQAETDWNLMPRSTPFAPVVCNRTELVEMFQPARGRPLEQIAPVSVVFDLELMARRLLVSIEG